MKVKILLNRDEDTKLVEEEEKYKFLKNLLIEVGIPVSEFWSSDSLPTIQERIQLRKILSAYNVNVIDDISGEMYVYVEQELIGRFEKPTYILRRDLREINPKKQFFVEMEVDFWTIFEQQGV